MTANEQSEDLVLRNVSTMPPPKKLTKPLSNGMPPPPPRAMPPPPPPPKFSASPEVEPRKSKIPNKTEPDAVPGEIYLHLYQLEIVVCFKIIRVSCI